MQHGRASRTAYSAAQYRAAHQVAEGGRIFTDPLATRILGDEMAFDDAPGRRAMRLFIAARTAFAEQALAAAVARGTRELVVLGAGLDTFGYRNPYPGLRVVEVDHPDTQAWKRDRLADARIGVPETLRYVALNFETETLADRLTVGDRTFFLWLGVVPYLTRAGFDETLGFIAGVDRAEVVFDYAMSPSEMPAERRAALEARAARVAGIGEPWQTYFRPAELPEVLHDFAELEDLGPAQLAARYFDRPDVPPDTPGGHVIRARKAGRTPESDAVRLLR
jgi:methyltransferase (TIGR00027 family)